ncbi:MAG: tetratricopeptide repeat protein [Candidatus Cloacimonetes bacterium]|nr:tetratricopeptide repeat protein [Candidatus Cloacimonadota bacterium]
MNISPSDIIEANLKAVRLKPDDFFSYFNLARAYEYQGMTKEALVAYHRAASLNPDDPYVPYSLAKLYLKHSQNDEAEYQAKKTIVNKPDFTDAHIILGRTLIFKGHLDEAILRFKKASMISPDEPQIYLHLAKLYFQVGFYVEALDKIKSALKLNSQNFYYFHFQGVLFYHLKKYEEASKSFRQASFLSEDDVESLYYLSLCQRNLKNYREAMSAANMALTVEPNHLGAYLALGKIYLDQLNLDRAISHFERVLSINPFFVDVHEDLAEVYAQKQQWSKCLFHIKKLDLSKTIIDESAILILKAKSLLYLNRLGDSLAILKDLLSQGVYHWEVYLLLGKIAVADHDVETAKNYFYSSLEIKDKNPLIYKELAEIEERLGNHIEASKLLSLQELLEQKTGVLNPVTEAQSDLSDHHQLENLEASYEEILQKSPEDVQVYLDFGDKLFEVGEVDKAVNRWEMAKALSFQSMDLSYRLSEGYRLKGDHEKAIALLDEIRKEHGDILEVNISMAKIYLENGKWDECKELLLRLTFSDAQEVLPLVMLLKLAKYQGDIGEMEDLCSKILSLSPDNALALATLGYLNYCEGKFEVSEQCYTKVIEKTGGSDWESVYFLGLIKKAKGNDKEAYSCFERVLKLRPDHLNSRNQLANLLKKLGNLHLAIRNFLFVLQLDARNIEALNQLGQLYFESGDFESSSQYYFNLVKIDSTHFQGLYQLGLSFYELQEYDRSVNYLKDALKYGAEESVVYYSLAQAYQKLELYDDAISILKRGLKFASETSSTYTYSTQLLRRLQSKDY